MYGASKKERNEIIQIISELWERFPEQRLGQLMENFAFGPHNERCCIFHMDDKVVLLNLKTSVKWLNADRKEPRWP
jgi:hypothetical protein